MFNNVAMCSPQIRATHLISRTSLSCYTW